jgi:hypothetical protein
MRTLKLIILSLTLFLSQGGYSSLQPQPPLLLDENGQVKSEKTYKDSIERWTLWYEDGRRFEYTCKDGIERVLCGMRMVR